MNHKKVVIIGIGNILLRDEGVGVHAAWALMGRQLPDQVEVIDGGTDAMDLLPAIQEAGRVIVIDALTGGKEPGAIYRVTPADLLCATDYPLSLHQTSFLEVLGMARQLGNEPEVVIIGVEPKEMTWGLTLTPEVAQSLPQVIDAVLAELRGL